MTCEASEFRNTVSQDDFMQLRRMLDRRKESARRFRSDDRIDVRSSAPAMSGSPRLLHSPCAVAGLLPDARHSRVMAIPECWMSPVCSNPVRFAGRWNESSLVKTIRWKWDDGFPTPNAAKSNNAV